VENMVGRDCQRVTFETICELKKRNLMTRILLLAMLLCLAGVVQAQRGRGGERMSPEERVERQVQLMTDSLALSEAQAQKVEEVLLKYIGEMQAARESSEGDWEALRETMRAIRQRQNEELKTLLTAEQYEKWQTLQRQRRRRPPRGQ